MPPHFSTEFLTSLYREALTAVDPHQLVHNAISCTGTRLTIAQRHYNIEAWKGIHVLAFGKASLAMARAACEILGTHITGGIVVAPNTAHDSAAEIGQLEFICGSHPIPDERSVVAGKKLYEYGSRLTKDDLAIVLVSGGGSALVEYPRIPLAKLQELTNTLLASGAKIQEINALRSLCSYIKNGGLATALHPASTESLVLSDVIGNDLASIASGATVVNKQGIQADAILKKYAIDPSLLAGIDLKRATHPGVNTDSLSTHNTVIGSIETATARIRSVLESKGISYMHLSDSLTGEAATIGELFAALCEQILRKKGALSAPCVLFGGGESTVTIKGKGKGGRNQELCLSFLNSLMQRKLADAPLYFLSAATDGIDGPTDAAGACCTPRIFTYTECQQSEAYLINNDAYHFFKNTEGLLHTGYSGTNVCDIQIACIDI